MPFVPTSRWARSLGVPLALLLAAALAGGSAALAQDDATPEADDATPAASGMTMGGGDPAVGATISYVDEEGVEIATITVTELTDPFEEFDSAPEQGARYVSVAIEVQSTGDELEVDPFDFGLQTADGFFYSDTFISLQEDPDPPELESTEVEEGESIAGTIFFQVGEEAELAHLFWQPESGRLLVIADLRDEAAS
jgi:hypothetical protein